MPLPCPAPVGPVRPIGHRGDPLDHRAGARIGQDRQPVGDRVLAGLLRQLVDRQLDGEDIGRRPEPAQRRGAHRRLGDEMMRNPLRRKGVKRLAVAGPRARRTDRLDRRRRWRRIWQRLGGEQIAAAARAVGVLAAPDFGSPVRRSPILVERRLHAHHHRRADRLEAELLVAPPAHPDRLPRRAEGDDRGVGRGIVGAVMAVATRPLRVPDDDRRRDRASASAPAPRAAGRPLANGSTLRVCRRDRPRARKTDRPRHARHASG